jgi:predicted dehydrogenase
MNHPVAVAVTGLGRIGRKHIELIGQSPELRLLATCDPFNEGISGVPHYRDQASMFAEFPELELIIIASPNGLHVEHSLEAIHAKKNIVIEKPVALHKEEVNAIGRLAAEAGTMVFPVMQNRHSPAARWLKEVCDRNLPGEIYRVEVHCAWNRNSDYFNMSHWRGDANLDGGPLYTLFSHFIDTTYLLFGKWKHEHVTFRNFRHRQLPFEDSGILLGQFESGAEFLMSYSCASEGKNAWSEIRILAQNCTIKAEGQYLEKISCIGESVTNVCPLPNEPNNADQNHRKVLSDAAFSIRSGQFRGIPIEEAADVVELIETAIAQGRMR